MKKTVLITDEERMGQPAFDEAVAADFAKEMLKPTPIVVYLPTAQRNEDYYHIALPID